MGYSDSDLRRERRTRSSIASGSRPKFHLNRPAGADRLSSFPRSLPRFRTVRNAVADAGPCCGAGCARARLSVNGPWGLRPSPHHVWT